MGALEYEPDGYIAKPVTLEILRTRLNKIIRTKDVYRDINQAIDRKDLVGALEACNRLAVEMPKFARRPIASRENFARCRRFEEARDILKPCWASSGWRGPCWAWRKCTTTWANTKTPANCSRAWPTPIPNTWKRSTTGSPRCWKCRANITPRKGAGNRRLSIRKVGAAPGAAARLAELNKRL